MKWQKAGEGIAITIFVLALLIFIGLSCYYEYKKVTFFIGR